MVLPRITSCSECDDVDVLIADIECQVAKLGGKLYNNITLMLNKPFSADAMMKLLWYKDVLVRKKANTEYLDTCYTLEKIAGRVKTLKYK